MNTVGITGASGFIGAHLVNAFQAGGWHVRALVRDPRHPELTGVESMPYDLREPVEDQTVAGLDALVHAALDKSDDRVNVDGTRRLMSAAQAAGVGRRVFISTVSARVDAVTGYARQKLACEQLMDRDTDVVVRAGLVIGAGGLVGDSVSFLRRFHVLPLIDGGRQPVQTVGVDDLARAVVQVCASTSTLSGVYTIADPRARSIREVYTAIADALDIRVLVLPIPFWMPLFAARASARLGVRLPITEDNLRGLRTNQIVDTADDLRQLGLSLAPLEDLARGLADATE
ncbi:MAG TPA: NAD-dependent epimerase/dehydratase family protein [Solirubrobacteraceae bacterium]